MVKTKHVDKHRIRGSNIKNDVRFNKRSYKNRPFWEIRHERFLILSMG